MKHPKSIDSETPKPIAPHGTEHKERLKELEAPIFRETDFSAVDGAVTSIKAQVEAEIQKENERRKRLL